MTWSLYRIINSIFNLALAVIVFFLGLRIVLRLFNANSGTPFVQWIYGVSDSLMSPFRGIFPSAAIGNNAVFDIPAFISLLAYALLFYLVVALIRAVTRPRDDGYIVSDHTHAV
jgi:YggT family protein